MSQVAQKPRPVSNEEAASLLDQVIQASGPQKTRAILDSYFDSPSVLGQIEAALPRFMQTEAKRLIKRALITFSRTPALHECTPASFVRCVVQAAEYGFAIDGVLCYAVPFSCKVEMPGQPVRWEMQCQFMPSYKGLVAVARRCGQIAEIYGDVVCEKDVWSYQRTLDRDHLEHAKQLGPRGDVIGTYVVIVLPNGLRRAEVMNLEEINHIKAKSKGSAKGPWSTDFAEMARKTVVKRALKMYADDPGLIDLIDADDRAGASLDEAGIVPRVDAPAAASRADEIAARLRAQQAHQPPRELPVDHSPATEPETQQQATETKPELHHESAETRQEPRQTSARELTPEDITNDFDRCAKPADVLAAQKKLEADANGDAKTIRDIQVAADQRMVELQSKRGK